MPFLVFHRPLLSNGIKACILQHGIACQLDVYNRGNLKGMIREYKVYVVFVKELEKGK